MKSSHLLTEKITSKSARVAIVGVGVVGSALADATTTAGFFTTGYDIDASKVSLLNKKRLPRFLATTDPHKLADSDLIIVCVPTPMTKQQIPDLSPLILAVKSIAQNLQSGQLIIVESSVTPQTTRSKLIPLFEKNGLVAGKDFFLAYSPERIDPANATYNITNTPKIVAGINKLSLDLAQKFYTQFIQKVVPVSSIEIAEMAKIVENAFRLVNISLMNELTGYTQRTGVDIWEVISAAATKPYGFLAHFPGAGAGGECIPILPAYLVADASKRKVSLPLITQALRINHSQPHKIVKHAAGIALPPQKKHKLQALLIGVAYKPGTPDIRESPAHIIWRELENQGFTLSYVDPLVSRFEGKASKKLTKKLILNQNIIIIVTAQKGIPYSLLAESPIPVLDTRNALSGFTSKSIIRI